MEEPGLPAKKSRVSRILLVVIFVWVFIIFLFLGLVIMIDWH
jgi:hypothetical protein